MEAKTVASANEPTFLPFISAPIEGAASSKIKLHLLDHKKIHQEDSQTLKLES